MTVLLVTPAFCHGAGGAGGTAFTPNALQRFKKERHCRQAAPPPLPRLWTLALFALACVRALAGTYCASADRQKRGKGGGEQTLKRDGLRMPACVAGCMMNWRRGGAVGMPPPRFARCPAARAGICSSPPPTILAALCRTLPPPSPASHLVFPLSLTSTCRHHLL